MIPTIYSISEALQNPDLNLRTLKNAKGDNDNGITIARRSTMFAEAEIVSDGKQYLLFCPLSYTAIHSAERAAAFLHRFGSEYITEYTILKEELTYIDAAGERRTADVAVQHIPESIILAEAVAKYDTESLLRNIEKLEKWLDSTGIMLNNVKPENIRVKSDGAIIPVRYHYARQGHGGDVDAFAALRRFVYDNADKSGQLMDGAKAVYSAHLHKNRPYLWESECIFEQLRCVEHINGFGFIDDRGNVVIPTQFAYAGDFREGRAEITSWDGKMGLIDKRGNYILEPLYEIVEFLEWQNTAWVRLDGKWGVFDYNGRPLTNIDMDYIDENLEAKV